MLSSASHRFSGIMSISFLSLFVYISHSEYSLHSGNNTRTGPKIHPIGL